MKRAPVVTDHAVLRYLERVHGIDLDHVRDVIATAAAGAAAVGARNVTRDGVVYQLRDNVVVTVIAANSAMSARLGAECRRGSELRLKNLGRRHRREQRDAYAGGDDE